MKIVSIKSKVPVIENQEEETCGEDEIIVKLKACGICGSDIGNIFEKSSKPTHKIGHEISGIISQIGEKIKDYQIGERIIINHHCNCENCHYCLHGNETMCEKFTEEISPCGLAEKFKISNWIIKKKGIFKIPEKMTFNEATMIEPLACCLRSWNKIQVQKNDSIMIFGFGLIGIFHSIIAKQKELKTIIVDDDDFRKKIGEDEKLGQNFLNFKNTEFKKYDEVIDLCIIANHDLACVNVAVNVLRKGGTILFFGEPRANSKVELEMSLIYSKEIKIITSYSATNKDFIDAMKFVSKNNIDLKKFVTHEFEIENAEEGIKIAKEGKKRIKVIITANK
ncbi:alcohol dehydrogenase catalytic domain-containing protein [Nitrosopumilus sp.]|jgi:L-iditol 2-dehydrogenase|nr:alcohol dehydrogenase catalytic domain-containing protein [Nitrosopumilus sp.]